MNSLFFSFSLNLSQFYFKIGSFKRWLRAWGFTMMREGPDRQAWYHRYFVRGVTSLCRNMTRYEMLKAMEDWLPAGQVPDFYAAATGSALSESTTPTIPPPGRASTVELAKNPKKLRGTVLEDLRAMLQDAEDEGQQSIVSWMTHGRAFKIHNKSEFATNILTRYFKASSLTHFSDTLRCWGFVRLKRGRDKGCYCHRYFVRGDASLSRHQSRQQMKQAMVDWPPAGGEPNFYDDSDLPSPGNAVHTHDHDGEAALVVTATDPASATVGQEQAAAVDVSSSVYDQESTITNHVETARQVQSQAHLEPHSHLNERAGDGLPRTAQGHLYPSSAFDPNTVHIHHSQQYSDRSGYGEILTSTLPSQIYYEPNYLPHPGPGMGPPDVTGTSGPAAAVYGSSTETDAMIAERSKGSDGTYVLRIHEMLEDAEKEGHTHIVSWQPHGRAFRIHKETEFVETIMPRYFSCKVGSFKRWLRAWGFSTIRESRDRGAWYHRYFIRGVTSLCRNMTRHQMLKAMEDWLPAGEVPDFYAPGTGMVLSDTPSPVVRDATMMQLARNPKKLRGTVPEDLRNMLDDAEQEGNQNIVSWLPHGRAFKVHIKSEFVRSILPRYFKAKSLTHFSDTLRCWGYSRLKRSGFDKGAYVHRYFVRGNPSLTRHLSREEMRLAMAGWPPSDGEPDFYDAESIARFEEAMANAQSNPEEAPTTIATEPAGTQLPSILESQVMDEKVNVYGTSPSEIVGGKRKREDGEVAEI